MDDRGALCYLIQSHQDAPVYLCVLDRENQQYHTFLLSLETASRLAHECSGVVNAAICGFSEKHAFQEVTAVLSKKFSRQEDEQ
jgi:hypothetical protein